MKTNARKGIQASEYDSIARPCRTGCCAKIGGMIQCSATYTTQATATLTHHGKVTKIAARLTLLRRRAIFFLFQDFLCVAAQAPDQAVRLNCPAARRRER